MNGSEETNDARLVASAIKGCEQSFRGLFDRYYSQIHSYAWKMCGDSAIADDISQQTFIKAAANLATQKGEGKFKTWLFQIALNTVRDHMRAAARYQRRLDQLDIPTSTTDSGWDVERINELLSQLPDSLRETIVLVFGQGLTQKEASKVLDCSEGTVAWRVSEARRLLKERNQTQTARS